MYIKQHSITKLKYFGKTTNDPQSYIGSGVEWTSHLKLHGRNYVETIWISEPFVERQKLYDFATKFSIENNIVESENWANRIIETGIGGGGKRGTTQWYNTNLNKFEYLYPSQITADHIKIKNQNLSKIASARTKNSKFFINEFGKQIRLSESTTQNDTYIKGRINFGKDGNPFNNKIKMFNILSDEQSYIWIDNTEIPPFHVLHNAKYIFCINSPSGLKMHFSEKILKKYLGTKGIKSLIDNEYITGRTKNKWLKSSFLNKNVLHIGFKYYHVSDKNIKDIISNLILEGYQWAD